MADYYSGNYDVDSFLAAKFIAEKAQNDTTKKAS